MTKKARRIFNDHVAPYDRAAKIRAREYDGIDPTQMYEPLLPLLPQGAAKVLDIGAGSGRDAAWLTAQGYTVVAVEPSASLRDFIREKSQRSARRIDVRDDMLPQLATLKADEQFDLILLGAVWQHVPPRDRKAAFNKVASHLKPDGMVYMLLREGPSPVDRKMYRVSAAAVARLAKRAGLAKVALANVRSADLLGRGQVRWTPFAARK